MRSQQNAFPDDELKPLSCSGRSRSLHQGRGDIDLALGNFSLTLIDSLDTLFILDEINQFEEGVTLLLENVNFDRDVTVSLFETNIRVLGGLLSLHSILQNFPEKFSQSFKENTQNKVLDLAESLGKHLLPAFNSPTKIPYSWVNLKRGIDIPELRTYTSPAEAGSLTLEFGLLSYYTRNTIYYVIISLPLIFI